MYINILPLKFFFWVKRSLTFNNSFCNSACFFISSMFFFIYLINFIWVLLRAFKRQQYSTVVSLLAFLIFLKAYLSSCFFYFMGFPQLLFSSVIASWRLFKITLRFHLIWIVLNLQSHCASIWIYMQLHRHQLYGALLQWGQVNFYVRTTTSRLKVFFIGSQFSFQIGSIMNPYL